MRISINKGCYDTHINILGGTEECFKSHFEMKRFIIDRILDKIIKEEDLDFLIKDLSHYIKVQYGEYNRCEQCGDSNEYEEYEL